MKAFYIKDSLPIFYFLTVSFLFPFLIHLNILLQNIFSFLGLIGGHFVSHNQSTAGDSPQKSFFACFWQKNIFVYC